MQPANTWLTAEEAAAYLKVKTRTILFWAREGKVKAYTLSGTMRHVWRFRHDDLDAMMHAPSALVKRRVLRSERDTTKALWFSTSEEKSGITFTAIRV